MIERVGALVNKEEEARALSHSITQQFDNLAITPLNLRAAYFIWRKPYMIAGKGTFIDSMLQKCGLINAFDDARYPEINSAKLKAAKPDVILLSSEPYPFKEKHIVEFNALLPSAVIKIVDGEMFSWYGSRLLYAPNYFKKLITELKSVKS
jgi:ABC-type Fe3+-hydroxamate transport system substrate-binding protein